MNNDFKKEIESKLKGCTKEQIVFFAWLCGVRALPLLGASGSFEYWGKKKQKHLYSVLYALDICAASRMKGIISFGNNAETIYTNARTAAVDAASTAAEFRIVRTARAKAYSAAAAYSAETATYFVDADTAAGAGAVADTAAAAAAVADAATTPTTAAYVAVAIATDAAAVARYNVELYKIILSDIKYIKSGQYSKLHNDIAIYGDVWTKFQKALNDIGCGYWGDLYARIFEERFVLDQDDLIQRVSNIPLEIRNRGAKAVAEYLQRMEEQGSKNLNEARIIILGEKGAGKTCLARRLIDPDAPMTKDKESTEGVETSLWEIPSDQDRSLEEVNAHIWDFAGHVITHAAHRCFLSERCLYVIVYNGRVEESNRLEYWLDHVKNYGGNAPVKILANLRDDHLPDIPKNRLQRKYPFIKSFSDFSIDKDIDKLNQFRSEVAGFIQSNPLWNNQKIPVSYYEIKKSLQSLFKEKNRGYEHIAMSEFDVIAAENSANEYKEQLLKDLHELGICLWYKDLKDFNTLILNPEWISHGIYKVINWAHNNGKYSVSFSDYDKVFADETDRYPKDKLSFIFQLMKTYELAYSKERDDAITIPFLLKDDDPDDLPSFPIQDSLMIEYVAEQPLPPNTISRLIVRHNAEIRSEKEVWRYGAVLKHDQDTIALAREDDRKITISVRGKNRSPYIARLRESMNDIFGSYQSERPELQYRIISHGATDDLKGREIGKVDADRDDIMVSERDILYYLENDRDMHVPSLRKDVPVKPIAEAYNINCNVTIINNSSIVMARDSVIDQSQNDNSTHNTFNFNNCNLTLQGNLNELANILKKENYPELAEEATYVVEVLEKIEDLEDKKEVIKSGAIDRVKDFIEDVADENSSLHKAIKTAKHGIKAAQNLAKTYNNIAQWVGWPQIPRPFLGNDQ